MGGGGGGHGGILLYISGYQNHQEHFLLSHSYQIHGSLATLFSPITGIILT